MNNDNKITYNNAFNMAVSMLENAHDSLSIRSALKEAGAKNGIEYGPPMIAFVYWAETKMGLTEDE